MTETGDLNVTLPAAPLELRQHAEAVRWCEGVAQDVNGRGVCEIQMRRCSSMEPKSLASTRDCTIISEP